MHNACNTFVFFSGIANVLWTGLDKRCVGALVRLATVINGFLDGSAESSDSDTVGDHILAFHDSLPVYAESGLAALVPNVDRQANLDTFTRSIEAYRAFAKSLEAIAVAIRSETSAVECHTFRELASNLAATLPESKALSDTTALTGLLERMRELAVQKGVNCRPECGKC